MYLFLIDFSALFMNLSLRSAGKKRLANDYKKTLKVISELLGNSNAEVRLCSFYVCDTAIFCFILNKNR
jgi:hypothetical protein